MKKTFALLLLLTYLLSSISIQGYALEESIKESVTNGSHSIDGHVPVLGSEQLITNAKSVVLYEVTTQTLMHAYNADEKLPPASFVKILTAFIAIEEGDLNSQVIVSGDVLDTVAHDAVKTEFIEGEALSLKDLLYCMLVDSGNDAAALIADHIAGTQEAFVEKLNSYAQNWGCINTSFTNVHGLHDDAQYTTARDMTRIMTSVIENETLCKILGAVQYTVPANEHSEERTLTSDNRLIKDDSMQIYYDARVKASRTGVAQDGTRCIASLAENDGLRFVSIIMGSATVYEKNGIKIRSLGGYTETSDLLDLGFEGYRAYELIYEEQILLQEPVLNGDCDIYLGTQETAASVMPKGVKMSDIRIVFDTVNGQLQAPIEAGQKVSVAKYMYGNACVAEVDLYAMNDVRESTTQLVVPSKAIDDETGPFMLIALIILITMCLIYMIFRMYRISLKKKRTRTQRVNHG